MSVTHWLIVALVVLVLFGGSRLGDIGKGLGEGIKNFKKGLKDEGEEEAAPKRKLLEADTDDEKPKKLSAKKVITVEVDENDDEDAIRRKIAAQKKVASAED